MPTKSTSKTTSPQWIAERRLERRDDVGGIVIVRIGIPEIDKPYTNWRCPFIIEGLGDDSIHFGKSDDSMAALQNALTGIRQLLERTGIPLRWEGLHEDYAGFPRDIPWEFGVEFHREMGAMIDAEVEVRRKSLREGQRKALKKALKKP